MTAPRIERIFTALDVGSWKVSAIIAGQADDGSLHVLGTGQRESRGVRKGFVADMDRVEQVVREAIEQAERIAQRNIEDVWVSFSAGGLQVGERGVAIDLGGQRVSQHDIDALLAAARSSISGGARAILHAQPALYTLDGLAGVRNPLGLHADQLGVDVRVITTDGAPVRNLEIAVRAAHLNVRAIVAAPVATGMAALTEEERDLGVALVELGAGITTVSLFAGGMLVGLQTLPFGASDITDDIASSFAVRRSQAQRLQSFYGSAMSSPRDNSDIIDLGGDSRDGDRPRITRAQLIGVIRQRLDQMMTEVGNVLKDMGFVGPSGRQVVMTGGGADLKGIADHAQAALGRSVRIGRPQGLSGLPEAHSGPAFATLAGLIHFAAEAPEDLRAMPLGAQDVHKMAGGWFGSRWLAALRQNF